MTVLVACQDAAKQIKPAQTAPATIFNSTDTFAVELSALVNEAAYDIAKKHDWRKLILLQTQSGNGSSTAFDLPSDYDRMPVKAAVFSGKTTRPMTLIEDLDVWLDHRLRGFGIVDGEWIILSGSLNIEPAMASDDSAKYYYVSKLIVTANNQSTKTSFTADDDTFRLPERLLTLALIWRWRHRKGLDYAEDMQNYEIALAQEIARDKGSRILRLGKPRLPYDADLAFYGTINA